MASHFREFECVAYAHVPKYLRGKLDDQSEKCCLNEEKSGEYAII